MSRLPLRLLALLAAGLLAGTVFSLSAQRKKKEEKEITQTLEILPDPPPAVTADTSRLVFHVAPLSGKGLLSQQTRDGIKALQRLARGSQLVKLRAFVAGTGDLRRVQAIVSEEFSEKRLPLPAVTTVQVGLLPLEGAQVVLESISVARKPANPHGIAFISGQVASEALRADQSSFPVAPLAAKSIAQLRQALAGASLSSADVVRVSCFSSSLDDYLEVRRLVLSEFPAAAVNIVQVVRAPTVSLVECEAVARLRQPPPEPVRLINPPGLERSPGYSQVALVNSPRVVISGAQLAFRSQESDIRLAFERLRATLDAAQAPIANTVMSSIYPLSRSVMDQVRTIRFEFYDKSRPPASTMLPFEGLPSLDATFALDVVAVPTGPR